MKKRTSKDSNQKLRQFDLNYAEERFNPLCGVDEAGRGPLAGPVVVCAAIVKDFEFEARIDDSKKLSPAQRETAYAEILTKCVISTSIIDEKRIDEINIYQATMEAVRDAVRSLRERPLFVLMDGPFLPDVGCEGRAVVDGDGLSFSIACASIAAKVTRDRMMVEFHGKYPDYGFDRHKGYGTPQHLEALKKFGPCPIHRRSFAPVGGGPKSFKGIYDPDKN